jgi:hypothetical protein
MNVIYKTGKATSSKHDAPPSRLAMIKKQTTILEFTLSAVLPEIDFHRLDSVGIEDFLSQFDELIAKTFKVISHVKSSRHRVNAALRAEVTILRKTLASFSESLKKNLITQSMLGKKVAPFIEQLVQSIDGFLVHFDTICDLVWAGHKFSFRPTERELKKKFLDAVIYYGDFHKTEKFAPYFWILKHLNMDQQELSPRTYGLWKKQLDEETFHHFVQPQKKFKQ